MTALLVRWALLLAVIAFGLGAYSGWRWGKGERDSLEAAGAATRDVAITSARAVTSMRDQFRQEGKRHLAIQKANQKELAARGDRLAKLEKADAERRADTIHEAAADEDCAVLRTVPVCAAVAERLWGDAEAAGTP